MGFSHPQLLAPARASSPGDGAWADYLALPAHYQGLLATLLGLEVEGGNDLNADILEQIRSLRLDRTHPTNLHLRGYQSFGARFALVQKKVILGDEMGLGKTIQAFSAAAHLTSQGHRHTLVICPASVITNWVRESRRLTDLPLYKAHGINKDDAVTAWARTGGICVVILCETQVKPSIEAQAVARVHRMGQTSTVLVHRLIAENTVDERMVEMLTGKEAIFDAYVRPSETATVHDAVDITEMQLSTEIIAAERKRVGFTGIK